MRIIRFIFLFIIISCKNPRILFKEDFCHSINKKNALKYYQANEEYYSLVLFTGEFLNENIILKNVKNTFYEGEIKTNEVLGLAKVIRVLNTNDIVFEDIESKYSLIIKSKQLMKYKFIYISKELDSKNKYQIIFSNTLCGFR